MSTLSMTEDHLTEAPNVSQEDDWSAWVIHDPDAEKDLEAIRVRKRGIEDPHSLFKAITLSASDARYVRTELRQRG